MLYYAYVDLRDGRREDVRSWYHGSVHALGLVGRVRVAWDGVNATLGGPMADLQRHIEDVRAHPLLGGHDIDFKLCESSGPASSAAVEESKFSGLVVELVQEVVSLGPAAAHLASADLAAPHASPAEFHALLLEALVIGAEPFACA